MYAISLTILQDSVMITAEIEANEKYDVVVIDLPGAFLHANMDEVYNISMLDKLAYIMVLVAPHIYRPFVTYGKNIEAILYITLQKGMYGFLRISFLFYLKLFLGLEVLGFRLNPYDMYVANEVVNRNWMTIIWHVHDLKISHVKDSEVTKFIEWLKGKYCNMIVSRGYKHNYLGMDFDYSYKEKENLRIVYYLKKILKEFPEKIVVVSLTPASDNIYIFRNENYMSLLDEARARVFHNCMASFLFVMTRCRCDIQNVVPFFCTRLLHPDDDY